jgi:hypothetical protein
MSLRRSRSGRRGRWSARRVGGGCAGRFGFRASAHAASARARAPGRTTPATAFGFGPGPAHAVLGTRGPVSLAGHVVRRRATFLKTLWAVAPSYRGPLLVRGVDLNHRGLVRFHVGGPIRSELRLPPAPFGWRGWRYQPFDTVLAGPGCHALQVDGNSFTELIVFAATA